jgi:antitoxin component YwqK of YwqJK toxin-antitoxin module
MDPESESERHMQTKVAKRQPRPADLPPCLPHAGEINSAKLQSGQEKKGHNRWRRFRFLAYAVFSAIGLVLIATIWVIHLNFGLMLNSHRKYREPTEILGFIVWHQGVASEFSGTLDSNELPLTGVWRSWNQDGELAWEAHFKNGCIYGITRTWNDGVIEAEMEWAGFVPHNGFWDGDFSWPPHGEARTYRNGVLRARQQYQQGHTMGYYEEFSASGNLVLKGQVMSAKPVGVWHWYDDRGTQRHSEQLSIPEDCYINIRGHLGGELASELSINRDNPD